MTNDLKREAFLNYRLDQLCDILQEIQDRTTPNEFEKEARQELQEFSAIQEELAILNGYPKNDITL